MHVCRMRTAVDRGDGGGVDETDALGLESRGQDDEDDAGRSSVDGNDEHPYGLYATREFEKDDIELMLEALLRGDSGDFKALQADSKASAANSSNTAGDVNARGHAPASGGSIQEGDTKQMHSNIGEDPALFIAADTLVPHRVLTRSAAWEAKPRNNCSLLGIRASRLDAWMRRPNYCPAAAVCCACAQKRPTWGSPSPTLTRGWPSDTLQSVS